MITTNLEQSKKLKELGAPQDAYFYWVAYHGEEPKLVHERSSRFTEMENFDVYIAAYTLSELIEWVREISKPFDLFELYTGENDIWYATNALFERGNEKQGLTAIEAVFNLAVAVKGKEEHV